MIRHVLLALVLASVFALLSVESVAAQSRAVQPPAVQSPTIELSGWETATLLRLQDLVDAELARRRASGDVAALRRQLGPTWAQRRQWPTQPSFGDAPRKRFHGSHLGRDRAGRGRPPGAGRVLRRTLRRDDSRHLPRVETPAALAAGIITSGVLLATVFSSVPLTPSIDPSRRTMAFTKTVSW